MAALIGQSQGMADEGVEKECVGVIWIGESPGIRLSVMARSPDEAHAKVVAEYGEGHVMTLRNELDAQRPR
jgi:hypothetical protein